MRKRREEVGQINHDERSFPFGEFLARFPFCCCWHLFAGVLSSGDNGDWGNDDRSATKGHSCGLLPGLVTLRSL